jgi:tRNA(fMet)-specific endonuclease VapC
MKQLSELAELLLVLPLPLAKASFYAEFRALLEAQGQTIGNNDLWIAAHAKAAGLTLITKTLTESINLAACVDSLTMAG